MKCEKYLANVGVFQSANLNLDRFDRGDKRTVGGRISTFALENLDDLTEPIFMRSSLLFVDEARRN